MRRLLVCLISAVLCLRSGAAERFFDFGAMTVNEPPKGFRSTVGGAGAAGDWRIVLDDVPPVLPPLTAKAPHVTRRGVLAQLSADPTDEHFPILIFEEESFGDFSLTTRFKTVSGRVEQMAGLVFRFKDEKNYYYVRASSLGNTFRFFKVVNGQRGAPIGGDVTIPKGVWHDMTVECKGNQIRCLLNGKEAMPTLTDGTFAAGKVGFWTKSDSVAYFSETKVVYTPRESLAQVLARDVMQKYPRLVAIRIYGVQGDGTRVIASSDPAEVGQPGDGPARAAISNSAVFYGSEKKVVTVTMPLHDRNGEAVAAVRLRMQSFKGQTEQNALARALPIVKEMEGRIRSYKDLTE